MQALDVMPAYAHGGDNGVLRGEAAGTVPVVQRHLRMANQIMR